MGRPQTSPDQGANLVPLRDGAARPTLTHSPKSTDSIDHLRLDDGMAAIERGLAVFIPPMAAAAFAALKLLAQFGNLKSFTDRQTL